MRTIVRIRFGSHLYGTDTPASDLDFKSVFVPEARDILLQRVKGSVGNQRPKAIGEKNVAGEIDEESYSLQRFLGLAAEGHTVALDVLFAPRWAMVEDPADEWREVIANSHRLLTSKSASFLGYCRTQANKYGIKGSRVAAARAALALLHAGLERHGTVAKLEAMREEIVAAAAATAEHMAVLDIEVPGRLVTHWDVCGRKMPFTSSIKAAHDVMARLVAEYGQRALQAERQEGVDWKALSHAVRVGVQAIELLRTGHVTFPLGSAPHLLDIKLGRLAYQEVAAEIEQLLVDVEAEAARSPLPAEPDRAWIDDFIARVYRREVAARLPLAA